jgi:hypothetical protein
MMNRVTWLDTWLWPCEGLRRHCWHYSRSVTERSDVDELHAKMWMVYRCCYCGGEKRERTESSCWG